MLSVAQGIEPPPVARESSHALVAATMERGRGAGGGSSSVV